MPEPPSSWAGSAHPPVKAALIGRAAAGKAGPVGGRTPWWPGLRSLPPISRVLHRPGASGLGPAPGAESQAPPPRRRARGPPTRGRGTPAPGAQLPTPGCTERPECGSWPLSARRRLFCLPALSAGGLQTSACRFPAFAAPLARPPHTGARSGRIPRARSQDQELNPSDSLTYEIRNRKSEEEEEALDEWIEVMEKVLPLSLIATKGGIESLISLCSTLIEGQKKGAQRTSLRKVTQLPLHISLVTPKRKVYHMDVEAQRRNLQLLSEEGQLGLPDYLRSKALELTTTTMELNALWLQCLCHKYILYRRFQGLRQEMINRIQVVQKTEFAWRAQNLYIFLENINHLQNLQLQAWTDKQKDLGEKCQECLSSMVTMFPKLQLEWNVNLHTPVVTSPKSRKSKPPPSLLQHTHSSSSSCKQPLELFMSGGQQLVPLRVACQQGNHMEAIWKVDVASSSHPVEKKTPASLSWDQLGGYPDTPRLLALDVHSSYHRSLMSLQA